MSTIIAGIDYSMSSPSICIHEGETWSHANCTFFYIASKQKYLDHDSKFLRGTLYPVYETNQERFSNLASWAIACIQSYKPSKVFVEGYSYGSTSSRLFEIGENAGLLKYHLWKEQIPFEVFAPTAIKKYATSKGNANKEKMWESFSQETNIDLFAILKQRPLKDWNPVSDLVDSYFICKYGHSQKSS